jgi:hypothetical protein
MFFLNSLEHNKVYICSILYTMAYIVLSMIEDDAGKERNDFRFHVSEMSHLRALIRRQESRAFRINLYHTARRG